MNPMANRIRSFNLLFFLFLLWTLQSNAFARERFWSFCQQGNQTVKVLGYTSSTATPVQRSYPGCTVRVTLTGTNTLATLYSDNSGTAMANPFVANSNGFFYFYADDGRYDATLSNAGLPASWTIGDILLNSSITTNPTLIDFGCVGDGTTNDTGCVQSAINSAEAAGVQLTVNGGKTFCVGTLTINGPLYLSGPGAFKRCNNLATGTGILDVTGSHWTFSGFTIDGQTTTPAQINYSSSPTPFDNNQTLNTSIWIHSNSSYGTVDGLTIYHTGGYAGFIDARAGNVSHIAFRNNTVSQSRSTIFGTTALGFSFGGWTGGFMYANDGVAYTVNDLEFDNNRMLQVTGNAIWGHSSAITTQNTDIRFTNNYCEDSGLDCIQVQNLNGGMVAHNYGRRIGYVAYNSSDPKQDQTFGTPAWIPTTPFSIPAVMIDTSGIVTNVDYIDNSADSINGGWHDADGFGHGQILPGVGTSCWNSSDPHAQKSLCGPGGSGVNYAYGVNMGNSNGNANSDVFVNILGGTYNGFGGGAIKTYGCSSCRVSNAVIYHPNDAIFTPIAYGPFTIGGTTFHATNSEISNNTAYWSPVTGAIVSEDNTYANFSTSDKNIVRNNICLGNSGAACYEIQKSPVTGTTTGPLRLSSVTPQACADPGSNPTNCIVEGNLQIEGTNATSWASSLYANIGGTGTLIWTCNIPFGCTFQQPVVMPGLSVTGGVFFTGLTPGSGGTPLCIQGTGVYIGGCGGSGTGGLADPGANGPVYRTALNTTAVATGAQLASVFTGCGAGAPLLSYTGGCVAGGAGGTGGYIIAATTSPVTINQSTHGQGANAVAYCWSGPPGTGPSTTGYLVPGCVQSKDAAGNFTFSWGGTSVQTIQILGSLASSGGGGGGMVYPPAGVPLSTGSAWGTSYTVGTAANNLVQLDGSGRLPAVSGANLTVLPANVVYNNGVNTGTAAMTLDLSPSTVANALRVPVAAGLTTTANGAIGYDSTANMIHAALNGGDAFIAQFTATPANGDCVNWVVAGGITKLGTTGSACGSGGGGTAFSALTSGTNTTMSGVIGTGASLSTTGSGTIAATSVTGFTPGAGTLTGPANGLILTANVLGVLTNNTLGNAATATAFDHTPTGCTNQWATGIATSGNLTCADINRINGTLLSGLSTGLLKVTTGTGAITVAASGTDYAPATTGSVLLASNSAGGFRSAVAADVATLGNLSNNITGTASLAAALTGAYIDWNAVSGGASILNKPSIPTITGGTCTNQVVTAISSSVVVTCNTVTSAYVNNTIALTGGDINTSSQVIATHLVAALPIAQGGTGTATPGIIAGTGISVTGSWPNQTITNTGGSGGGVTSVSGTSPIVSSGGTTPAISCATCLTTSTTFSGPAVTGTSSGLYAFNDIRRSPFNAVCNGTNQHTAVLALLNAGLTSMFIPAGCNWTLPHGSFGGHWSYNPGTGTITVPDDSVPGNLTIVGENWVTSTIQTATPSAQTMYIGPQTILEKINVRNFACNVQQYWTGTYVHGDVCPMVYYMNGSRRYSGTVSVSGTNVTYSSGDQFLYDPTGQSSWTANSLTNPTPEININGSYYTVTSVSQSGGGCSGTAFGATCLTVSSSAGFGTVPYFFDQYRPLGGDGYQFLSMATRGPGDFNALQAGGFGGDTFFAGCNDPGCVAFRGSEVLGDIFYAERQGNGMGYYMVDDPGATSGFGFRSETTHRTSGTYMSFYHSTTNWTSSAAGINFDFASGSGTFTGSYIHADYNLQTRFDVNQDGQTKLYGIQGITGATAGSIIYLGANIDTNSFLDRNISGGQIIVGYNTPQGFSSLASGTFQVYNHSSTGQKLMMQIDSAGAFGGQDAVRLPNLPTSCSGQLSGAGVLWNNSGVLSVCP